jgi:hypothetical protein
MPPRLSRRLRPSFVGRQASRQALPLCQHPPHRTPCLLMRRSAPHEKAACSARHLPLLPSPHARRYAASLAVLRAPPACHGVCLPRPRLRFAPAKPGRTPRANPRLSPLRPCHVPRWAVHRRLRCARGDAGQPAQLVPAYANAVRRRATPFFDPTHHPGRRFTAHYVLAIPTPSAANPAVPPVSPLRHPPPTSAMPLRVSTGVSTGPAASPRAPAAYPSTPAAAVRRTRLHCRRHCCRRPPLIPAPFRGSPTGIRSAHILIPAPLPCRASPRPRCSRGLRRWYDEFASLCPSTPRHRPRTLLQRSESQHRNTAPIYMLTDTPCRALIPGGEERLVQLSARPFGYWQQPPSTRSAVLHSRPPHLDRSATPARCTRAPSEFATLTSPPATSKRPSRPATRYRDNRSHVPAPHHKPPASTSRGPRGRGYAIATRPRLHAGHPLAAHRCPPTTNQRHPRSNPSVGGSPFRWPSRCPVFRAHAPAKERGSPGARRAPLQYDPNVIGYASTAPRPRTADEPCGSALESRQTYQGFRRWQGRYACWSAKGCQDVDRRPCRDRLNIA